jgi:hypothetical protein
VLAKAESVCSPKAVWEFFEREYQAHGAERHMPMAVVKGCEGLTKSEIERGVAILLEMGLLLRRGATDLYLTDDGRAALQKL